MLERYLANLRRIHRDAWLMIAAQGIMGFGYVGLYSVLFNLYLLRLGYDAADIGQIQALGRSGFALFGIPAGLLGVRLGPRPLLILGELIIVIGLGGAPLGEYVPAAWQFEWITFFFFLGWVGACLFFVNSTPFLMAVSEEKERPHVFSAIGTLMPIASFGGALVGGFLPGITAAWLGTGDQDPAAYRFPLILAGLLFLLTVPLVVATRHGRRSDDDADVPAFPVLRGAPWRVIGSMSVVMALSGMGVGVTINFFNVYLDDGLGTATTLIGTVQAATNLIAAPAALLIPFTIQRFGHVGGFIGGRSIMALTLIPMALIPTLEAATITMLAIVSASAVSQQIFNIHTQAIVSERWRTLMSGVLNTTLGISWGFIAWLGGWIIESYGYPAVFLMAATSTALTVVVYWAVARCVIDDDDRGRSPQSGDAAPSPPIATEELNP